MMDEREFDDGVKEWFPLKSGISIVKKEADHGVKDRERVESIKTMPSHFGSYILSHSSRLMNDVFNPLGGFQIDSIHYGDTDSLYIHKQYWSDLVNNGFVGRTLGLSKID